MTLEIKNLYVSYEGKPILKGLNMKIEQGKIHGLMGPNGSGKTTLAYVLAGHPKYKIESGAILLDGKNILQMSPDERAKLGLFLSFQNPIEISGITISNFLRQAYNSLKKRKLSLLEFRDLLERKCRELKMDAKFLNRYLNQGFSGGEKKKAEILQMLVLDPKIVILDETDSGLDIDSLRIVAQGIKKSMSPEKTIIIITHYKRILDYVQPDKVSIIFDGRIALEGGRELVDQLEEKGYRWVNNE